MLFVPRHRTQCYTSLDIRSILHIIQRRFCWTSFTYSLCFAKCLPPQIINFNRVFHYKPSILGAHPYFWKHLALFLRQVATVSINQFAPALALLTSLLGCRWRHDDVGAWLTVETHRNAATGGGHGSLVSAFPVVNIAEHQNLPENHGGSWRSRYANSPPMDGWIHLWQVCILVPCSLYFSLALPYYWSVPWLYCLDGGVSCGRCRLVGL